MTLVIYASIHRATAKAEAYKCFMGYPLDEIGAI